MPFWDELYAGEMDKSELLPSMETYSFKDAAVILHSSATVPARQAAPDDILRGAMATKSDLLFCVPSMIEAWCRIPEQVEWITQTQGVFYGGGPLASEVGDPLARKGVDNFRESNGMDWAYFSLSSCCGTHFVPLDDENAQLILTINEYQVPAVLNTMVDGVPAYDTNDILAPHPTKKGLWKVAGRSDEHIMHSTGEKPQSRFDINDEEKLAGFRNAIWPTVEKVNSFVPQHSRLFKAMIIVSSPSKPFTYTTKGTPRRPAIITEYQPEIEALYATVNETTQAHLPPPRSWSLPHAIEFVRCVVQEVMTRHILDTDDIFQKGCDSLQATWIRNSILHALRQTTQVNSRAVPGNFDYQHPSISGLAQYVSGLVSTEKPSDDMVDEKQRVAAMHVMVQKYSRDLPRHTPKMDRPARSVVLVTGTTGSLGAALLAALVDDPKVSKVYAFNRKGPQSLEERQRQVLAERGYDAERIVKSGKVVFIDADTSGDKLGLQMDSYEKVRTSVTHILHNDTSQRYEDVLPLTAPDSMAGDLQAFPQLLRLEPSPFSPPPQLLYVSSIGMLAHASRSDPVLEEPVDASIALASGYTESKWVSETLLENVGDDLAKAGTPLRTVVVRLGQITGSSGNGAWNTTEQIPALVKSSTYLRCLPDFDAEASWIAVNAAARATIDMLHSSGSAFSTYHLTHPRPVHWRTLFAPIAQALELQSVAYDVWLQQLRNSSERSRRMAPDQEVEELQRNPALKLVEHFEEMFAGGAKGGDEASEVAREALGLPKLSVAQAVQVAPSLSEESLPQLTAKDTMQGVRYWKSIGYLQ
ncbi:uncharacterized protein PHACADRAFT_198789 [Phanerochaete carnosa HHB-10118-sp]|uniref:Thioester reductase (TE) domain-containing protein n=1 Tax=Phanerochaete carnosa (strain HHB-10118-sp) TaxID=650164 RepID=K5W0W6_PHACS|nr:uncharacterized protein PHACADRAFT_198789 [Phanerochaete carnosa HHB-10118-sp]EKM52740.1 hypothetical protein PHACADRAFT_198789 [Phanerochaete carnosa HHB-10118-sp]